MTSNDPPGPADRRLFAAATARNREPILAVLHRVLPPRGLVLEVASGTGEHAAWFAPRLPHLIWQPSDLDATARASITAHAVEAVAANLLPPITLDSAAADWPIEAADAVVCINMIHIAPWRACRGLIAGAGRLLGRGGVLYLYGPFRRDGRHTAPSNEAFDRSLRMQDPEWGVRNLGEVATLAAEHGFALEETVAMPANNLSVVFRKAA